MLITWMRPFSIQGLFGGIFHTLSNILLSNSEDPDQRLPSVASDLCLYCLPISHKKDAQLIRFFSRLVGRSDPWSRYGGPFSEMMGPGILN